MALTITADLVMVPIGSIHPYERNPRRNDATIDRLVELIPKVGFNVPLVLDRQNIIVKGHSRWLAAQRLGMPALPCVYTDADAETIKLDRLADNRVQEFSTWDQELLVSELASLNLDYSFNLAALDFDYAAPAPPGATSEPEPAGPEEAGEPARDAPFISEADIAATAPVKLPEYAEIVCPGCGNHLFVKKKP